MRAIHRSTVLGTAAALLSWSALQAQETSSGGGGGAPADASSCTFYCTSTAAVCTWTTVQMGINPEYCAGWLAGCLTGCQM